MKQVHNLRQMVQIKVGSQKFLSYLKHQPDGNKERIAYWQGVLDSIKAGQ